MAENFSYQFFNTTRAAWEAMYAAIGAAQKSVFWELYGFDDKIELEFKFADVLIARAVAGVEIKLILDGLGSFGLSRETVNRLRNNGVEILWFNSLSPWQKWRGYFSRLWRRNHRKILIVDEVVGFIGGVNARAEGKNWDDLVLKIQGRTVRTLLRGFAKSYVRCGGDKKKVRRLLHPKNEILKELGAHLDFIFHSPLYRGRKRLRLMFKQAIQEARARVNLLTPYYSPDKEFLQLVAAAARRGVEVNIILPERSDVRLAHLVAQAYYDLTVAAGARLYFLPKMNHGKAITVDDNFGSVGSANLTPRSFHINEEANVYFSDEKMVAELNGILNDWKKNARPFDKTRDGARGWRKKFRLFWAKIIHRWV